MKRMLKKIKRKIYIYLNPYRYRFLVHKTKLMAHALGGIDNKFYTNSLEALETNYNLGFRLFETDLKFSTDKKLILNHTPFAKRLNLDENLENIDSTTFKNSKIYKKYTPMLFKDLVTFMKTHKDMYVMIDIGKKSADKTEKFYNEIINISKGNTSILQRLIVSGHTLEMLDTIKSLYDFKICNLYCSSLENREDNMKDVNDILNYCKKNNISSISLNQAYDNEDIIKMAKNNKIITYLFTINDINTAKEQLKKVTVIGTDFIKKI